MTTLGLVGRGAWSQNIRRTLARMPGVEWIDAPDLHSLGKVQIDAAIIANRSSHHVETALAFLKAGVTCFIEKPVATSMRDLERLREAAAVSGAQIFAGHIHLFNPAVQVFLKELAGLGALASLHGEFANAKPREDVSVLWDWLPHPVSIARRIFQKAPDEVAATPVLAGLGAVEARMTFGQVGFTMNASWFADQPRMEITAECAGGSLTFNDKAAQKVTLRRNGETIVLPHGDGQPLTLELENFLDVLAGKSANAFGFDEAAYVVQAVSELEASALSGGTPRKLS